MQNIRSRRRASTSRDERRGAKILGKERGKRSSRNRSHRRQIGDRRNVRRSRRKEERRRVGGGTRDKTGVVKETTERKAQVTTAGVTQEAMVGKK